MTNDNERDGKMNWESIEGQWKQLKGNIKQKWAKLTDDDVRNLSGKREELVGRIQERYGCLKDEAEQQVDEWIAKIAPRPKHRDEPRDHRTAGR
jgi:uncharacterized protein YjbJ (UPF0337 family)